MNYIALVTLVGTAVAGKVDAARVYPCQDVLRRETVSTPFSCWERCRQAVRIHNIDCCGYSFEPEIGTSVGDSLNPMGECTQFWHGPKKRIRAHQSVEIMPNSTSSLSDEVEVSGGGAGDAARLEEGPEQAMATRFLQFGWQELRQVRYGVSVARLSPQAKRSIALAQSNGLGHLPMSIVRLGATCVDPNNPSEALLSPGAPLDVHYIKDLVWSSGSFTNLIDTGWGGALFGSLAACADTISRQSQHSAQQGVYSSIRESLKEFGRVAEGSLPGNDGTDRCSADYAVSMLSKAWDLLLTNPIQVLGSQGPVLAGGTLARQLVQEADQAMQCAEEREFSAGGNMFTPAWGVCWELLSLISDAFAHDSYSNHRVAKDSIAISHVPDSSWPPKIAYGDTGLLAVFKAVLNPLTMQGSVFPRGSVRLSDVSRTGEVGAGVIVLGTSVLHDRAVSGRVNLEFLVYAHYDDDRFSYGREVCAGGRAGKGHTDDCEKGGLYRGSTVAASNFWVFSCHFAGGVSTPATVYSRVSMYAGPYAGKRHDPPNDRSLFPDEDDEFLHVPSLRVTCPFPRHVPLVNGPWQVDLRVNTHPKHNLPSGIVDIPVQVVPTPVGGPAARRRVTICTQPLFNAAAVERKNPGLIRNWLWYHLEVLGVSHFQMYDLDGSFAPYVTEFSDKMTYLPHWSNQVSSEMMGKYSHNCKYCSEMLAYDHCLFSNRGISDWVLVLHAPDCFIAPPPNSPTHISFLLNQAEAKKPRVSSMIIRRINIGAGPASQSIGANETHPGGVHHGKKSILETHTYAAGSALNNGMPLVRPSEVTGIDIHNVKLKDEELHGGEPDPESDWRANHYADMMGMRCQSELPAEFTRGKDDDTMICHREDTRLNFVVPLLRSGQNTNILTY